MWDTFQGMRLTPKLRKKKKHNRQSTKIIASKIINSYRCQLFKGRNTWKAKSWYVISYSCCWSATDQNPLSGASAFLCIHRWIPLKLQHPHPTPHNHLVVSLERGVGLSQVCFHIHMVTRNSASWSWISQPFTENGNHIPALAVKLAIWRVGQARLCGGEEVF